ncbi:CC178 protein, partial [Halcyon senegalensis]|nr:CC178 protein [Halcyon senegalensis]
PDKNKCIITKQRSCTFVNTPLPCINKAIHHIQELELKMEKCFQQVHLWLKMPNISSVLLKDVYILNVILSTIKSSCLQENGKTLTLKQETEALLLEVTELIKRLEADREEAEKALELEKQRRKKLSMKIDRMSLWRLQQLPAAVQKEYEMWVQDTLELRWHLACRRRRLGQVQRQVEQLGRDRGELLEETGLLKKHSPLLEAKLNLEEEALKDVLLAYEKVKRV